MRHKLGRVVAAAAAALVVGAWSLAVDRMALLPESRLWVDGTSSVRAFTCRAGTVNADVATSVEHAVQALLTGENAVKSLTFSVPAAKLDCGNGTMNGHMLKAIKAKEHATIAFQLESYTITTGGETLSVTLRGTLALGGATRPITMNAALAPSPAGALRVSGVYELNMKDYDLTPPSLMFGTLKVGEMVKVNFDLVLR